MKLCGRDQEIRTIIDDCKADHMVVVSHEPGLGATALFEAGLLPALTAEGCIALTFSAWQGRFFATALKEALAEAVRQQADPGFFAQPERLDEMLERVNERTGRVVVLLCDQFEDYLRCHSGSDISDAFDAELSHAIAGHYGRFVLSLQRHSLKPFERLSQYIPNMLGYHVELGPLPPEAAREAVLAEVARRGMQMEPAAVNALLECKAASHGNGVHPFFLMKGVTRLLDAESRLKSTVARASTLELNGGADRLILESLDGILGDLNTSQTELFFRWCTLLISPEQERLSVTEKGLVDYAGKLNRFALSTLPLLREMGLLRSVEMPEVTRYELAGECLAPIVKDWWQRREAAIIARHRAMFRIRSVSVAAGCIVAVYVTWLILTWK